jgi:hypothetical protein
LTAIAIKLILPSRMLITAPVVFAPQVHIHSPVSGHDLGQMVFQEVVLMSVYITFIAEVSIVIFAKFGSLGATRDTIFNL